MKSESEKHTHIVPLTPASLKAAREKMGRNRAELAAELGTPYRTYQDWEAGRRGIPLLAAVAVGLMLDKDAWVMHKISVEAEENYMRLITDHRQRMENRLMKKTG